MTPLASPKRPALPDLHRCPVVGCQTTLIASRRMCSSHWLRVSADNKAGLRSYDNLIAAARTDDVLEHLFEQRAVIWRAALRDAEGRHDG